MSSNEPIRVMIADDHPVVRQGLRDFLGRRDEIEIVADASDGAQAVSAAHETQPDVIIMDVLMPNLDGVEACREIRDQLPDTKVLMLTASGEEDAVVAAVAAGATGYVHKFTGSDELVNAVRDVSRGRLMIPEDAVARAFELIRSGASRPAPRTEVLTAKERRTLRLFSSGMSYKQIAEARGVGMTTVRNAMYRIQDKLGVTSKQEVVVWAVRSGLLDADQSDDDA